MGKEVKIGLAVVSILLAVFGALLFRRLMPIATVQPSDDPTPSAEAAAAPGKPPAAVMVQNDAVRAGEAGRRLANTRRAEELLADEATADMPRRGFMPSRDPTADGVTRDRYGRETAAESPDDEIPSAAANPFDARPAAHREQLVENNERPPKRLEVSPTDATALEARNPSSKGGRNPLRRLSAEEPVDDTQPANEPLTTTGAADDLNGTDTLGPTVEPDNERTLSSPEDFGESRDTPSNRETDAPTVAVDIASRPRDRDVVEPPAEEIPSRVEEPAALADGKYTVQPNDSLWTISEKVYGTGRYFKAIYEHNRTALPRADQLTVGTVIAVPPAGELEKSYPALCPKQRKSVLVKPRAVEASPRQPVARGKNVYVVEQGDTLFDIARWELGKASRWAEIYELNRGTLGEDFDYLQPGTELKMPQRDPNGSDSISRQRDSRYTR